MRKDAQLTQNQDCECAALVMYDPALLPVYGKTLEELIADMRQRIPIVTSIVKFECKNDKGVPAQVKQLAARLKEEANSEHKIRVVYLVVEPEVAVRITIALWVGWHDYLEIRNYDYWMPSNRFGVCKVFSGVPVVFRRTRPVALFLKE